MDNGETKEFGRAVSVPQQRFWRAARLGAMTAGVARNMAAKGAQGLLSGERPALRDLLLTPSNIQRITGELARMRGAAMKLGQLVSMDAGEVLPPELAQIMARLRAEADFMPPKQLRQVLNAAWGPDWLKHFKQFDVRPIAAASIGQVHRAVRKDGRAVAIKVQYPGVARSIDSDVANVAALVKMSGLMPQGFALDPYVEEARKQLHEETDYLQEAAHLRTFQSLLADTDRYELPEVHDDLTVPSVLCMSYLPSVPLEDVADLPSEQRNRVAGDLIDLVLRELFEFRTVQSDPNFANFRYNPETERLVLLDFGATRQLDPAICAQYRSLITAGLAGHEAGMHSAAQALGLWDTSTDEVHMARLTRMMGLVFEAIKARETYDFTDQTLSQQMTEEGIALAQSGFVPPPVPMDVLFIQRKLGGVFLIAANLKAALPLEQTIRAHLTRPKN
ncbi:MAG: AarF/ABC1/UbiB kinase family protein [Pseudomonadota bacterium]